MACYGPMMGMAQFVILRPADVFAAEFSAFQVLTRRLHIYPRAIAGAIVAIQSDRADRTFDQQVAGLQGMPGADEFVTQALLHSLERFRF